MINNYRFIFIAIIIFVFSPLYITISSDFILFNRPKYECEFINCYSFHFSALFYPSIIFIFLFFSIKIILSFTLLFLLSLGVYLLNDINYFILFRIFSNYIQTLFFISSIFFFYNLFKYYSFNKISFGSIIKILIIFLSFILIILFLVYILKNDNDLSFIYDLEQYFFNNFLIIPFVLGLRIRGKIFDLVFYLCIVSLIILIFFINKYDVTICKFLIPLVFIIGLFKIKKFDYQFFIFTFLFILFFLIYLYNPFSLFSNYFHTLGIRNNIYIDYFSGLNLINFLFPITSYYRQNSLGSMHSEFVELFSFFGLLFPLIFYSIILHYIYKIYKYNINFSIFTFIIIFFPAIIMSPNLHIGSSVVNSLLLVIFLYFRKKCQ